MAQWYAIVDDATGRLVSSGDVIAERLPAGLVAIAIDGPPRDRVWDTGTRTFSARPAPVVIDRIQDLANDARFAALRTVLGKLNASDRQTVRDAVALILGPRRFRDADEDSVLSVG